MNTIFGLLIGVGLVSIFIAFAIHFTILTHPPITYGEANLRYPKRSRAIGIMATFGIICLFAAAVVLIYNMSSQDPMSQVRHGLREGPRCSQTYCDLQ